MKTNLRLLFIAIEINLVLRLTMMGVTLGADQAPSSLASASGSVVS